MRNIYRVSTKGPVDLYCLKNAYWGINVNPHTTAILSEVAVQKTTGEKTYKFLFVAGREDERSESIRIYKRAKAILNRFHIHINLEQVEEDVLSESEVKLLSIVLRYQNSCNEFGCSSHLTLDTKDETLAKVASNEYKYVRDSLEQMGRYIEYVQDHQVNGNFNMAIINDDDIPQEEFLPIIYDYLSVMQVRLDPSIERGDLESAEKEINTPHIYLVNELWTAIDYKSDGNIGNFEQWFAKLIGRKVINIMVLHEKEYQKLAPLNNFLSCFPNKIVIDKTKTQEIKYNLLKQYAESQGVGIAQTFEEISKLDASFLKLRDGLANCIFSNFETKNIGGSKVEPKDIRKDICKVSLRYISMKRSATKAGKEITSLDDLVGLQEVKDQVKKIANFVAVRGIKALPSLHMVFTGNPGTGKTSVARLLSKAFADAGVFPEEKFIEVDRSGLVGRYIGETEVKTNEVIDKALGGILFIDEAYALDPGDSNRDYGNEAISTLVKRLEDNRKDFICIMAGYTKKMQKMLDSNPGMRDRIQFYINFPDYNANELMKIFNNMCANTGYTLTEEAAKVAKDGFKKLEKNKGTNFANARTVRKLFEKTCIKQALRTKSMEIIESDIKSVFDDEITKKMVLTQEERPIGFLSELN